MPFRATRVVVCSFIEPKDILGVELVCKTAYPCCEATSARPRSRTVWLLRSPKQTKLTYK